jgi:cysteine dioxygenase
MSALPSSPPELTNHVVSIQEYAAELRRVPETAFAEVDTLREFQRRLLIRRDTLQPYLLWDGQHYTRNLIDRTPLYELLAICWEVGQASSIHNHAGQHCWMAAPVGRLLVQNYRTLEEDLQRGTCRLEPSDLLELNVHSPAAVDPANPVHKVYNPRSFGERAVSLHIYSRPFDSCIVYSDDHRTCGPISLVNTSEYGVCKDPRLHKPRPA